MKKNTTDDQNTSQPTNADRLHGLLRFLMDMIRKGQDATQALIALEQTAAEYGYKPTTHSVLPLSDGNITQG